MIKGAIVEAERKRREIWVESKISVELCDATQTLRPAFSPSLLLRRSLNGVLGIPEKITRNKYLFL